MQAVKVLAHSEELDLAGVSRAHRRPYCMSTDRLWLSQVELAVTSHVSSQHAVIARCRLYFQFCDRMLPERRGPVGKIGADFSLDNVHRAVIETRAIIAPRAILSIRAQELVESGQFCSYMGRRARAFTLQ